MEAMNDRLSEFLNAELDARRWSMRELGRRAGVSGALVSEVINGNVPASANFCVSVALAFGESPERLLRMADILPPLPASVENEQAILRLFQRIPPAYHDLALRVLEAFATVPEPETTIDVSHLQPGDSVVLRRWTDRAIVKALVNLHERLGDPETDRLADLVTAVLSGDVPDLAQETE